jgi:hypothetical protein
MAQPTWLNKYLTIKPEVSKVFDDLDAYLDFCRFELRDYNPAHLYDRTNHNYRAYLDSQRAPRPWANYKGRKERN